MRVFTTIFFAFFMTLGALQAQLFLVNSPAEIQGYYSFEAAEFGADLTSDVWTGDAVFVDDGSANPTFGCNAPINTGDLAGKIALVDRGGCEFGLKCLNAENAGAIAVVVFNNAPGGGTIVMGAGAVGTQVTIPCVMLTYEDGQTIRAALAAGAVNISLGALGAPANDLAISAENVMVAPLGIVPSSQIKSSGDFVFVPGAQARNIGLNEASNVSVNAVIEFAPFGGTASEVYNESASQEGIVEADSTSELILLPVFEPTFSSSGADQGVYTITYTVASDSTDDVTFDNTIATNFTVSENLYSKASWNPATGDPRTTIYYTISGGGDIEFLSVLNIPYGEGYKIDSIVFAVLTSLPSLANIPVEAYVYEWNDLNEDGSIANDEVEIAGIANFTFPESTTGTSAVLRLPVLDFLTFEEDGVVIAENNKDYIIGVRYTGEESVFFGFDLSYDYGQYLNLQAETGALTDRDYGYLGINAWDNLLPNFEAAFLFTDLTASVSTGVILTSPEVNTREVAGPEVFEMELFPNPVSERLQINLTIKERTSFVEYHILDAAGRLIFNARDTDVFETEQASFNVSQLPAGQYNLMVRTQQGIQTKPFIVKR